MLPVELGGCRTTVLLKATIRHCVQHFKSIGASGADETAFCCDHQPWLLLRQLLELSRHSLATVSSIPRDILPNGIMSVF